MGVGVPVCLIYIGVQSVFRAVFGKDRAIFCADMVFSVIAALVSFFFMVFYNNGQVRLHLVLGEALGFFLFMRTVGKHVSFMCNFVADVLHSVVARLLYPFLRVSRAFVNIFRQAGDRISRYVKKKRSGEEQKEEKHKKIKINSKKFDFLGKILLKIQNKSV